jgi:hypothetical protein
MRVGPEPAPQRPGGLPAGVQRCGGTERGNRFEEIYPQDFPPLALVVQGSHATSAPNFPQRGEWGSCRVSRQGEPAKLGVSAASSMARLAYAIWQAARPKERAVE